jgi:hypothetical protein
MVCSLQMIPGLDGADINFALNNLEGRGDPTAAIALYS